MAKYQGHRSWNAWNVSLWINHDEGLYGRAVELAKQYGIARGAKELAKEMEGESTPDGARYNLTCIREAMREMI